MSLSARFETFRLTRDGDQIVYAGRTPDNQVVEIRQPAADADVMLVLLAGVLEKARKGAPDDERAHQVLSVGAERRDDGMVVVSLVSPPNVTRRFRMDRAATASLVQALSKLAGRPPLRLVP